MPDNRASNFPRTAPRHTARKWSQDSVRRAVAGYHLYIDLMAERCAENSVACWAYLLMPDDVHLILVPMTEDGLAQAVGEAHRRYAAFFNARACVTGHLFQGRFTSAASSRPASTAKSREFRGLAFAFDEAWICRSEPATLTPPRPPPAPAESSAGSGCAPPASRRGAGVAHDRAHR